VDEKDKTKNAIISAKGGKNIGVNMIYGLCHIIEREKADIGVFIYIGDPTRPMVEEAAKMGFYHSPLAEIILEYRYWLLRRYSTGNGPTYRLGLPQCRSH
jgi:hypothetical protein